MRAVGRSIAKMFCIGLPGPTLSDDTIALLKRGVANVVLFKRNCESPEQIADLCATIKEKAGHPVLISIDHEGGRVQRLSRPFTPIPPMRALGQINDPALATEVGKIQAKELRAVNIDINFAPVLDVDTNKDNPVINSRSFSSDPQIVSALGVALLRGIQSEGIAACGKHFLGHGDTSTDSHKTLPRIKHKRDRLDQIELPPFQAAIAAGVSSIMTAHVIFDCLDKNYPVTMSPDALDGILRDQFKFDGVIFSDDLEMKAIASNFSLDEALVRGVTAGVDVFPISHSLETQNKAIDSLLKSVERKKVPKERIDQSNRRIDTMAALYYHPPSREPLPKYIGSKEHHVIVERVRKLAGESALAEGKDPTDFL